MFRIPECPRHGPEVAQNLLRAPKGVLGVIPGPLSESNLLEKLVVGTTFSQKTSLLGQRVKAKSIGRKEFGEICVARSSARHVFASPAPQETQKYRNNIVLRDPIVIWMLWPPPGGPRGGPLAHSVAVRRHAACQITIQILKYNRNRILNARGHTRNRTQTQNITVLRIPVVIWMARVLLGVPEGVLRRTLSP